MDSGSAAPTLMLGVRDTAAVKDLIWAMLRCGGVTAAGDLAMSLRAAWCADSTEVAVRSAFILARDNAGSKRPAMMEMMTMTTRSSISVNAREAEAFITMPVFACYEGLDNATAN